MISTLAFKKKLDLIGKHKAKNILLVQPIQVSEKKLDIKISLNRSYYLTVAMDDILYYLGSFSSFSSFVYRI